MTITETILQTIDTYSKYRTYIKVIKPGMLPDESFDLIKLMGDFYAAVQCEEIDWEGFRDWLLFRHSNHTAFAAMQTILERFLDVKDNNHSDDGVFQLLLDRARASEVAQIALAIAEGEEGFSWDDINSALERFKKDSRTLSRALSRTVEGTEENLLETLRIVKQKSGLTWCLKSLDAMLGRLNSELVFVAARPDGGKTTFLAHNAWNWATQIPEGKCVLWFNNEESITKVQRRVWCSALEMHESEIVENIEGANAKYRQIVPAGRIVYIDDADDVAVVEAALDRYSPAVIIMDQLYKIRGMESKRDGNDAERFRALCNWARDIAKHTAPVVATNQLDGTAEGVMYPTMSMLYGSKTGAQGEADIILTIGRIPSENDKRFIHTPKNKVTSSDTQTIITLDRFRARYYDYVQ